jgi:hypothetical protein
VSRADGYTEEQIKAWCACAHNQTPDSYDGPDIECPLHGGMIVQWQVFTRDGQPWGSPLSEEPRTDMWALHTALEYAERAVLQRVRRTEDPKAYLQYRLISPWHA